jgi:hypothetical protein
VIRARAMRRAVLATAFLAAASRSASSQDSVAHGTAVVADLPFGVGEKLEYDVSLGGIGVGKGSMEVAGWDSVRGHRTMHSVFTTKGGILWFKVNDQLESHFDPYSMISYAFVQHINEVNYHRIRDYQFYPERSVYQQEGKPEEPSVAEPLDDGAFFYFVRTVPLEVGKTYEFHRYFIADRNPVIVKVLRRDTVKVDAGTFPTIVIQPIIKSNGLFSEGGEALMWLSDDPRHILVQMKVKTKVPILKSLNLYLKKYTPPGAHVADSSAKP